MKKEPVDTTVRPIYTARHEPHTSAKSTSAKHRDAFFVSPSGPAQTRSVGVILGLSGTKPTTNLAVSQIDPRQRRPASSPTYQHQRFLERQDLVDSRTSGLVSVEDRVRERSSYAITTAKARNMLAPADRCLGRPRQQHSFATSRDSQCLGSARAAHTTAASTPSSPCPRRETLVQPGCFWAPERAHPSTPTLSLSRQRQRTSPRLHEGASDDRNTEQRDTDKSEPLVSYDLDEPTLFLQPTTPARPKSTTDDRTASPRQAATHRVAEETGRHQHDPSARYRLCQRAELNGRVGPLQRRLARNCRVRALSLKTDPIVYLDDVSINGKPVKSRKLTRPRRVGQRVELKEITARTRWLGTVTHGRGARWTGLGRGQSKDLFRVQVRGARALVNGIGAWCADALNNIEQNGPGNSHQRALRENLVADLRLIVVGFAGEGVEMGNTQLEIRGIGSGRMRKWCCGWRAKVGFGNVRTGMDAYTTKLSGWLVGGWVPRWA
uniref:Uncharacterized protein n=1 Tax=Mycena chlorophos TaxID=658473 RepID=A0ABQ0L2S4_MYCCL|nr:predicted protein [Mycena chlorophos]